MDAATAILGTLLVVAAIIALLQYRGRINSERRTAVAEQYATSLQAQLEAQRQVHEASIADRTALRDAFSAAANDVLKSNEMQFLSLADQRLSGQLKPVADTLKELREFNERIEKNRNVSYGELKTVTEQLRSETGSLANALRKPQVRGRYGEIQLRRVIELAGMRDYCDFDEQAHTRDAEGRALRPDCVVRLPNDRHIVIDAKNNTERYMEACTADSPEAVEMHLKAFARAVLDQARALAKKEYWREYQGSPDVVVMFIPGDQFIDAALQHEPELLEIAASHRVLIAGPASLIGLLRAVWVGWREKSIARHADHLLQLGQELHKRAGILIEHINKLGNAIDTTASHYNALVGSVDRSLMPTLRRFEQAKMAPGKPLVEPKPRAIDLAQSRHSAAPSREGDARQAP